MNELILSGRIVRDPEVEGSGDKKRAIYTLAVNGTKKDDVDFFKMISFGKTADVIEKYCTKGTQIIAKGRIKTNKFTKDGVDVMTINIITRAVEFVGSKIEKTTKIEKASDEFMNISADMPEELPFS